MQFELNIVNIRYSMLKFKFFLIACIALCFVVNSFGQNTNCPIDSFRQKIEDIHHEEIGDAMRQAEGIIDDFSVDNDTICTIKLYSAYAKLNGGRGNYYLVFNAFWKALLLAEQANLEKQQFYLHLDIARFYGYLKRYKKAIHHFQIASKFKKQLTRKNEMTDAMAIDFYFFQMSMYKNKGDMEVSARYLDSCYQHVDSLNITDKFYYLEFERAISLVNNQEYEEALTIFNHVLDSIRITNPGYQSIIYTRIGDAYRKMAKYDESIEAYHEAININELYESHIDYMPVIYTNLAEIHYQLGNYKKAYEMSGQGAKLDFELFDSRSERNSYLMNVQDDFRVYKEQEQERVRQQELIQLKQSQRLLLFQLLLLIVSLLFLSMLGFIYFKLQKGKIKAEKTLNNQLQQQNLEKERLLKRIERKNQELITFSNIMTHDLKAPLHNISAFTGLIQKQLENGFHKDKITKYLSFIDSSADSMTVLIQDLLLYSKIDLEEREFSNVALNDIVKLVLPAFSYDINASNVTLNIETLPAVYGDKSLLKTVFHNLISNGIKYQPKNQPDYQPKVNVWAVEEQQQYHIFVEDNGIGIDPKYVDKLFKPFVRFHSSKEYAGTGLGMSICERIMTNHKGSIQLEHTSPEGSRFKLTFPKVENVETPSAILVNSE